MKTHFLFYLYVLSTGLIFISSCATSNQATQQTLVRSNQGNISLSELTTEQQGVIPAAFSEAPDSLYIEYPDMCWNAIIEGTVRLFIDINEQGDPTNVKVSRGIGGGCDRAAWTAIGEAKYRPATDSEGSPVSARHWIIVTFNRR